MLPDIEDLAEPATGDESRAPADRAAMAMLRAWWKLRAEGHPGAHSGTTGHRAVVGLTVWASPTVYTVAVPRAAVRAYVTALLADDAITSVAFGRAGGLTLT